ncbi:MAG: AraC family transcriptional regulator [Deltaproteobacteria bacterium]|nr:AraC family transcriptional regulator [Deltaproteobacteria bacterium]
MTKKELERDIKLRFNMDLCHFFRNKIDKENLFDYEIAHILNVNRKWIARLKDACGAIKGSKFTRRFERVYGPGSVDKFKKLVGDRDNSLSDVARQFGFSREYARQVYKKIYGRPYTEVYKKKRKAKEKRRNAERIKNSKRVGALVKVSQKIKSMGIIADIINEQHKYMILTNRHKLIVKTSVKPTKIGSREYYRINYTGPKNMDCDFLVCLCGERKDETHFVIPWDVLPKCTVSLLPQAGPDESKYSQFKEAWHLLKHTDDGESRAMQ